MLAKVHYIIGSSYEGDVLVFAEEDEDDAVLIARAKKKLGPIALGMASEKYDVVSRERVE